MKNILIAAVLFGSATSAFADTAVQGYFRQDGTYVDPHYRSNPDGRSYNNYSTQGNVNPYTGRSGTVDPYSSGSGYSGYGNSGYGVNDLRRYGR